MEDRDGRTEQRQREGRGKGLVKKLKKEKRAKRWQQK